MSGMHGALMQIGIFTNYQLVFKLKDMHISEICAAGKNFK